MRKVMLTDRTLHSILMFLQLIKNNSQVPKFVAQTSEALQEVIQQSFSSVQELEEFTARMRAEENKPGLQVVKGEDE